LSAVYARAAATKTGKKSSTISKASNTAGQAAKKSTSAIKNAAKRGGPALSIALNSYELATAAPCERGKVAGKMVVEGVGSAAGAALLGAFVPGVGHVVGGALGGLAAGWLYDRFSKP